MPQKTVKKQNKPKPQQKPKKYLVASKPVEDEEDVGSADEFAEEQTPTKRAGYFFNKCRIKYYLLSGVKRIEKADSTAISRPTL